MKTFKIKLVCMLFGVYTTISAQNTYFADPTNYVAVANQIMLENGFLASVESLDLINYLDDVVHAAPFNPNSTPPPIIIDDISSQAIKVSWIGNPLSTYEISLMNLNDGSTSHTTTSANNLEILNPTPGKYLINIVKFDLNGITLEASSSFGIIKEIAWFIDPGNGDCDCVEDLSSTVDVELDYVPHTYSGGVLDFDKVYDPETDIGTKYKVVVTAFGTDGGEKTMYFQKPFASAGFFFSHCAEDFTLLPVNSGTLFALATNTMYGALWMNPSNYQITIGSFPDLTPFHGIGKVSIAKCAEGEGIGRSNVQGDLIEQPLHIFPNPATDLVKIHSQSNDQGALTITNQLGQVIFTKNGAFNEEEVFVQDWPKGIYYVTMTVKGLTTKETFAKINY